MPPKKGKGKGKGKKGKDPGDADTKAEMAKIIQAIHLSGAVMVMDKVEK